MMVQLARARRRRTPSLLLTAVIALGLCGGVASPGLAARTSTAGSLAASPARAIAGEHVALTGKVPPYRARSVVLQREKGRSWVKVETQRSSASGRFAFTIRARSTTTTYRVLAPKARIAGHTYAAVETAPRTVTTVRQKATLALPGVALVGQAVTATATIQPARPGRTVQLERKNGSVWTVDATGAEKASGRVDFSIKKQTAGAYQYRVVAVAAHGAAEVSSRTETVTVNVASTGGGFLTAVSPDHRSFLDQDGSPIMVRGDTAWGLVSNAGRWSGTWQSDIDTYVAARASEGFNAIYVAALGNTINGGRYDTGATWDGVSPWDGGSTSSLGPNVGTLDSTYWNRVDYLVNAAKAAGVTVLLDIVYGDDIWENGRPGALSQNGTLPTNAQMTTYGQMLGQRYKDDPNLVWMIGGDYFGNADAKVSLTLDAIRAAGADQLISVENWDKTNSYATGLGKSYAQWSDVYSYAPTYRQCEIAWKASPTIPLVWMDGYYDQDSGASNNLLYRQELGWALTSGSRGSTYGSESVWEWHSGALDAAQHPDTAARQMVTSWNAVSALPEWSQLAPDTDSTTVLTGDRGTKIANDDDYTSPTNDYITGSITPDGTLALIYVPVGGTAHVTWANMKSGGRTAKWLDPTTGQLQSVAAGNTSYTTPGKNAAGQADWYLVLQAGA